MPNHITTDDIDSYCGSVVPSDYYKDLLGTQHCHLMHCIGMYYPQAVIDLMVETYHQIIITCRKLNDELEYEASHFDFVEFTRTHECYYYDICHHLNKGWTPFNLYAKRR